VYQLHFSRCKNIDLVERPVAGAADPGIYVEGQVKHGYRSKRCCALVQCEGLSGVKSPNRLQARKEFGDLHKIAVTPDPANTGRSVISISDSGITHELSTDLLVGGSISGLLKYQNEDLVSARNQLGQMAAAVSASAP